MTFTAHNIRLDNGTFTKPDQPWEMRDLALLKFAIKFLTLAFPGGFKEKRIVDLGCLEGGYAVEFAREGFASLGIEVRPGNIESCNYVKANTSLPNLSFACDDVRNLENYEIFDAIFCCGILYHLDQPRRMIEQMSKACRRAIIIDTHVAAKEPNSKFNVSDITENEGLSGRWFSEFDNEQQRRDDKWSSWDNPKSFWPMKRDLIEALRQVGFGMVLEYPIYDVHRQATDRVTIVGVKD